VRSLKLTVHSTCNFLRGTVDRSFSSFLQLAFFFRHEKRIKPNYSVERTGFKPQIKLTYARIALSLNPDNALSSNRGAPPIFPLPNHFNCGGNFPRGMISHLPKSLRNDKIDPAAYNESSIWQSFCNTS